MNVQHILDACAQCMGVSVFIYQWVEHFMHKTPKICVQKSIWQSSNHDLQMAPLLYILVQIESPSEMRAVLNYFSVDETCIS